MEWSDITSPTGPIAEFFGDLGYGTYLVIGPALIGVFAATLAWPFITGWMAKARRASNGKAGS